MGEEKNGTIVRSMDFAKRYLPRCIMCALLGLGLVRVQADPSLSLTSFFLL